MNATEEKQIMYDSDEAASLKTVTGWVSSTGRFWGNDEQMARYEGCTHKKCECGGIMKKGWLKCDLCITKQHNENYLKLPFKEWDGETPLYDDVSDKYFFSEDDLIEYLDEYQEENNQLPSLKLFICEPNYPQPVDSSYWEDCIPESMDELPKNIWEAIEELNKRLKEHGPFSWSPGKFRTSYETKSTSPPEQQ